MLTKILALVVTLISCWGIVFIFDLRVSEILSIIKSYFSSIAITKDDAESQYKRNQSLAKTINFYKGKKESFLTKEVLDARNILSETRQEAQYGKMLAQCLVFAALGVFIGILFKNIFLIPALALGLFFVPLWKVKLYHIKYEKYTAMQLESSISLITTSYLRNNDIIEAVTENLPNISGFLRNYFEEFVAEYKVNANMKSCIRNLQRKINNAVFREWCDCLIRTYENSEMKENLLTIANKLSAIRIVQDELDAEMFTAILEYIVMMGILLIVYPMVYFINKEWFALYSTTIGKICVTFSVCVAVFAVKKLFDVMTPVKYEK